MRYTLIFIAVGIFFTAVQVNASLEDVIYPIAELGNCESQEACFAYCDLSENYDACMAYAEAKEIIPTEEIEKYRQIQEVVAQGGPGGCTSEAECEAYCGDLTHIDECLSFAQENGLMSGEELQEAQQVKAALDAGYTMPGGCTDEASCESYCSDATHMEECIAFGKAAGFISEEEAAEAEKFLTIMQSGGTPGGCQNQGECEAYCADGANAEECLNFAVEAGFMTQEEADAAREMGMELGEEFVGPGGCTDEESCRSYCEQEANQEECQAFFGDIPMKDEEEGGPEDFVGPGGCLGEEACRAFCADPVNQETCAVFFGESQGEEHESTDEFPSQEFRSEYEGESEYLYEGSELMPGYQYEGGQTYDIYEYGEEGYYEDDEFESFVPGETLLDLEWSGKDDEVFDGIYVEPPSEYGEQPGYDESIYGQQPSYDDQRGYEEQPSYDGGFDYGDQPSYNESPIFPEPAPSGDMGAPPADSGAPSPDSGGGESHSTANVGFVNSARQFLGKVIRFLSI